MYTNIITTSKKVQKSINIDFDIHNKERIDSFIPTASSCQIIDSFMTTILEGSGNFSNLIVGPYGKGKSMLMLVISELVSNPDDRAVSSLAEKIGHIDPELKEKILVFRNRKEFLLPVIINGSEDMKQAFLLGLDNALKREGLEAQIPETLFSACLATIKEWEENTDLIGKMNECLLAANTTQEELVQGLQTYRAATLERFKKVYECLSLGIPFNPLISSDPIRIYELVLKDLEQTGRIGFFILFDELGKTLEDQSQSPTSALKIIQDFAELANRSAEKQMVLFTAITHKSLDLYADEMSVNQFRTVEGRFNEVQIRQTPAEGYQMVALSLEKLPGYQEAREAYFEDHLNFYTALQESQLVDDTYLDYIESNTFPFNPAVVPTLMSLSERVAQNERTLFTAIIDDDPSSFKSFIETNSDGLYCADRLYDYFASQIGKDGQLKNLWYRTQSLLNLSLSDLEKQVIKALAVLLVIKEAVGWKSDVNTIALLLSKPVEQVNKALKYLEAQSHLNRNLLLDEYSFSTGSSWEIDTALKPILAKKAVQAKLDEAVVEIMNENFVLPYRYNLEYKMTRYFKMETILASTFLAEDGSGWLQMGDEDGKVISILGLSVQKIPVMDKIKATPGRPNVIYRFVELSRQEEMDEFIRYTALGQIDRHILSEAGQNELDLIRDELRHTLQEVTYRALSRSEGWNFDQDTYYSLAGNTYDLITELSDICERIYSDTPVINNEMINRHKVSSGYEKALSRVNNDILARTIHQLPESVSPTSPERSIYRALFEGKQRERIEVVLGLLKGFLLGAGGGITSFGPIVEKLKASPYGIREGLIPSFLAMSFSELESHPILYFKTRQIQTTDMNLRKVAANPKDYYVQLSKDTAILEEYLAQILNILDQAPQRSFYENLDLGLSSLKRIFNRMPVLIRESTERNNPLGLSSEFLKLKKMVLKTDLNSYSFFAEFIPETFQKELAECPAVFEELAKEPEKLNTYQNRLVSMVVKELGGNENGSIRSTYEYLLRQTGTDPDQIVMEGGSHQIKTLLSQSSYDDKEILNDLSHQVTGYGVEDWSMDRSGQLINAVHVFKTDLEKGNYSLVQVEEPQKNQNQESEQLSMFGTMLYDSLAASLDEFAGSVTNAEKILILQSMIEKIVGDKK